MQEEFKKVLNDIDPELEYRRRNDEEKKTISWGQRKLLLSLISFLSEHLDKRIESPIVVYAGAAPGINIGIAAQLFPNIVWHLYDPQNFKLKTDLDNNIIVYRKKFTNKVAKYWSKIQKEKGTVYFISDIRTADYTKAKDLDDNEHQILKDMELQRNWVDIIQPVKAHLKFRLPYVIPEVPKSLDYFEGTIYRQPWAPQTSTETRLVCQPPYNFKTYDCEKYQSQMFHHNVVVREKYRFENAFSDGEELINDWDSNAEIDIWKNYLNYLECEVTKEAVLEFSKLATRLLTKGRKYQDTLSYLRAHPRAIKDRNFKKNDKILEN